ncbi:MAG: DUF427 domain-containing protein [Ornithinimicrobium sp.]
MSQTDSRPAAESTDPGHYPGSPVAVNHTEPVARRVRAMFDGLTVVDTVRAIYVWEHPYYPQLYIPAADVDTSFLTDSGQLRETPQGQSTVHSLTHGDRRVDQAARLITDAAVEGLAATYRFEWDALDAWFEEDEEMFLHVRSPYVRVDSLRSSRRVRIEKDGVVLADSTSPVILLETGLPPRYYLPRTDIFWQHLRPCDTQTRCPYKGTTTGYWSVDANGQRYADLAWSYDFPTRESAPVAGLVCFLDEKLDVFLDDPHPQPPTATSSVR